MSRSTLCIGIDFGTTFSGVSWAWSGRPDQINTVTTWPTRLYRNSDREKTPTEFYIDTTADGKEKIVWGYDVPAVAEPFRWFKLLLVDESQLPDHLRTSSELIEAREKMGRKNLDPVKLVAKYLNELWKHAIKHIENTLSENTVNECRFHIVLTVPAIWKDAARQQMTDAAEEAGLLFPRRAGPTTLDLVSEPEAGAISTFSSLESRPDIKQGDSILIVDAGGGTVDLISYTVESLSPFRLSECVEGSGGLCGAVFVDRSFRNFLRNRLTPAVWDKIPPKDLKRFTNNEWEHGIKQEFDGVTKKSFTLDLPNSCSEMFEDCEFTLEHGHVKEIFDHVVEDVNTLAWKQLNGIKARVGTPPKYVILVGGFGRCQYLATSIRNIVDPSKTSVLQGTGSTPWTAVCRGAVLHGLSTNGTSLGLKLPVQISSRISRAHYGIVGCPQFQEGVHNKADKYFDEFDCIDRAWNQVDWYVLKGDKISTLDPKIIKYRSHYKLGEHSAKRQLNSEIEVYTSTQEPAPSRFQDLEDVKKIWQVKITCPVIFKKLPIHENKQGVKYRTWNYQVKMVANGSSAGFEVYDDSEKGVDISAAKVIGTKRIYMDCDTDLGERFAGLRLGS